MPKGPNHLVNLFFARKLLENRARECGLELAPSSRWGSAWALYDASNNVRYYQTLDEVNEELLKSRKDK